MRKNRKPNHSCFDYAIWLLGRRAYAQKELREKLTAKMYEPEEVTQTLARLDELGYVNDETFARERVRSRAQFARWGKSRIQQELKQKGVNAAAVEKALQTLEEGDAERGTSAHSFQNEATELLFKKFGAWPAELPLIADGSETWEEKKETLAKIQKEQNRRLNFLIRRGFSFEEAQTALTETKKAP